MTIAIFQILGGLVLLLVGGEALVKGAVSISKRLGISPLFIGMIVVAFTTSIPELVASIDAALLGNPDMALGNIVGSTTSNILLILGIVAVISPIFIDGERVRRDLRLMVLTGILLFGVGLFNFASRLLGVIFIVLGIAYIGYSYWAEKSDGHTDDEDPSDEVDRAVKSLPLSIALFVGGLGMLIFGANYLVIGASFVATVLGISQAIIGLTIVAIGTSLPELATGLISALRGHSEIAVGNVVGSSIMNVLLILGITLVVKPFDFSAEFVRVDIPIMIAVSLGLAVLLITKHRISRRSGVIMLVLYGIYAAFLYLGTAGGVLF